LNELKAKGNASLFYIFGIAETRSYTLAEKATGKYLDGSEQRFKADADKAWSELLKSDNFRKAMTNIKGDRKMLLSSGDTEYFDYAVPVGDYILYFRYYKVAWQEILNSFNRIIIVSLVIALVIAFVLGYMLSKTITSPIVRLMYKARSIAAGDFEQLQEVNSDDEIGKLTVSFNYMATSLKNTLAEISSEKNKIETILNYMTDGVIAFNLKGEIIHTNPASRNMLGIEGMAGNFKDYAEKYGIDFSIEEVIYLQSSKTREMLINAGDRTIRVYFAVFTDEAKSPEGIIAVLQDITDQQKLENMRREFVANVSHELRTPLTSIKSYSETLLDGALEDPELSQRFLGVINSETDRMTRIVKDLLQLSKLDNQQMQWKMESVGFVNLIRGIVERMQIDAQNKKQKLECFVLGDIPEVKADRDRLEQVVVNILSNSIKYTPDEGKIIVYIGKTYNEVYVKIADSGIGIPEKDLPRIFERFYRVDKARSRDMGGTGLGLAIAKEIVEAHSGTISIASEPGKGTEVVVRLPAMLTGEQTVGA
jgi:two-component system sensor histidine kinase VicK